MDTKVLLLGLVLALVSIRCTEETIISSQDALVDARFAPKILFSEPALNSVGPYPSWGAYPLAGAKFYLRFNKLMDPVSVANGIALRSSQGGVVAVFQDVPRYMMTENFVLVPYDSMLYSWEGFGGYYARLGETLTLYATQEVRDINGNVIPPGVLGTFVPEPAFRVQGAFPTAQYTSFRRDNFHLRFNSPVDSSVLAYISVTPPATLHWSNFSDDSASIATPLVDVAPGLYTLTVAAGAPDKYGHASSEAFTTEFRVAANPPMVREP